MEIVDSCEKLTQSFANDGKVENAADYLIDAQILKMSHDLMGSTTEKMGNSDFSEDEYIASILNIFTDDHGHESFDRLTDNAVKCCRTFNNTLSMLGTFDFDAGPRPEKPRRERQAKARQTVGGPVMVPEHVKEIIKSDHNANKTQDALEEIRRVCLRRKTDSLPYFEVICHPKCFMKSVDIAFQVSFLVRDGLLGLRRDGDQPYIFLYDPNPDAESSQRERQEKSADTVQCVMVFNPIIWRNNVKKYKLRNPLLELDKAAADSSSQVDEPEEDQQMQVDESD